MSPFFLIMKTFKSLSIYLCILPLICLMLGLFGCKEKEPTSSTPTTSGLSAMPDEHALLDFELRLELSDLPLIKKGFEPQDMNDKWIITYQEDSLSFYRSWTGNMIYHCTLKVGEDYLLVSNCLANRNPAQVRLLPPQQMNALDIKQLSGLISMLLDKKL